MAKKVIVVRVSEKETQIVHMERGGSYPTVYGCVRFPTPEKAVQDGMIMDMSELAVRLHKICVDKGIKTKEVIFTISSSKLANREVNIPVVNKAKIEPLVMAKIPDLLPIDQDKYVFAYLLQGKARQDDNGDKIQDVMVYAAPAEIVDSYYALADAAGLRVVALEAEWNAVFQMAKRQEKDKVSLMVQIDDTTTLATVYKNQRLLLQRVIPYGINVFTEAMTHEPAFRTPTEDEAYALLKKNRVIMPALNAENPSNNPSMEKRIEVTDNAAALIGNIGRIIEYYNNRFKENNEPIEEVLCMGQGCAIAGIHQLLANELGLPTSTPQELYGVRFNRNVTINAYILQYLSCFGAVFEPVNFVPRAVSRKNKEKGSMTGAVLIFIGCLLLTVAVNGFSVLQLITTRDENETLQSRVTAMSPIQDEYDSLTMIEIDRTLVDAVDKHITTNNNNFHNLLKEIESRVPKSFTVQSISSDEQHVDISATSTDKLLSLSALQIQLNKIDGIENVKLDSITESTEAMTKQKQYTYNLSFDYVVEIDEALEAATAAMAGETQEGAGTAEGAEGTEAAEGTGATEGEEGEQP